MAKISPKPFVLYGALAVAIASGVAGYAWREEHRPALLEIYVFDLKSGWSVFIRTPDDKRILINGGANSEVIRELTKILPFYSRRIDMIIVTDADGKDASGLIDVLERYAVDTVVVPAISLQMLGLASSTDQVYEAFMDTVRRLKVPVQGVSAGDRLVFGQKTPNVAASAVKADILFPAASSSFAYSKASAPEIIMQISYGDTSVMLLGNATTKVQKFLASSAASSTGALRTDVLVIPHSAGASSLSSELMDQMKPDLLVYSQSVAGPPKKSSSTKNEKADPLYFVLDDKRFNVKEKGTIRIVSDGSSVKIDR